MQKFNMRYSENDLEYEKELAIRKFNSHKFMAKLYMLLIVVVAIMAVSFELGWLYLLEIPLIVFVVRHVINVLHIKTVFRIR